MASSIKNKPSNSGPKTYPMLETLFERAQIKTEPKVEQRWEQIEDMFQVCAESLIEIGHQINSSVHQIREANIDGPEIALTVQGISKDLNRFADELQEIHSEHQGRSGQCKTPDDLREALKSGTTYMAFQEKVRGVLFPNLLTITEYVNEAIRKENAANPNVITDVEVKGE